MSFLKVLNGGYLLGLLAFTTQVEAVPVQIDLSGTVSNAYILEFVDGVQNQHDANNWNIGDIFSIGSTINFKFSFDTTSSSIWSAADDNGSTDAYDGSGFELQNDVFQVGSNNNVVGVINNFFDASDEIYSSLRVSENTGLKVSYQNELYYLVDASINIIDETGKALDNSQLSLNQSQLDAFWSNKPEDAYWNNLGMFGLRFLKDLSADSWPNGEALYVVGYFEGAQLSTTEVPEPASLYLLLIGGLGLALKRARTNKT